MTSLVKQECATAYVIRISVSHRGVHPPTAVSYDVTLPSPLPFLFNRESRDITPGKIFGIKDVRG